MAETPKRETKESETSQKEELSYTPANIYQRVYAWIGVVYMVIVVFLVTWFIATGTTITGITGIMLAPALIGFGIAKGIQAYKQEYAADRAAPLFWCILSEALGIASLIWGVVQVVGLVKG